MEIEKPAVAKGTIFDTRVGQPICGFEMNVLVR